MRDLRLRKARQAAARLLESFGIERADQLEDLAWAMGAHIVDGGLQNALARVTRFDKMARIRVSNDNVSPGQRRFSIAHELGHLVLGHRGVTLCKTDDIHAQAGDSTHEQEANVFAADMLLPARLVQRQCETSPVHLGIVESIAAEFETSLVATAIRFAELTSERCAVVLSQRGKVRWVVRSETFWPRIARAKPLLPWSIAHDYFRSGKVSDECEEIDASAWVDGDRLRGAAEIYEHARVIPSINAVLSLLWIPESCGALAHRY